MTRHPWYLRGTDAISLAMTPERTLRVTYRDGTIWESEPVTGPFYWPQRARHARRLNGSPRETPARSAMHAAYRRRNR